MFEKELERAHNLMYESERRSAAQRQRIAKAKGLLEKLQSGQWDLEVSLIRRSNGITSSASILVGPPEVEGDSLQSYLSGMLQQYIDQCYAAMQEDLAETTKELLTSLRKVVDYDAERTNEPSGHVDGDRNGLPQCEAIAAEKPETP